MVNIWLILQFQFVDVWFDDLVDDLVPRLVHFRSNMWICFQEIGNIWYHMVNIWLTMWNTMEYPKEIASWSFSDRPIADFSMAGALGKWIVPLFPRFRPLAVSDDSVLRQASSSIMVVCPDFCWLQQGVADVLFCWFSASPLYIYIYRLQHHLYLNDIE